MPPAFTCSLPGCEVTAMSQRDHVLTITAHTTAPTASRPRCGISSRRIHSYYYLHTEAYPERARSRRGSLPDPYVASRQKRWDAGCHHGVQLWRAIHALGFPGTRRMVSNWVVWRREVELGRPSAYGRRPALPKEPAVRLLSAPVAGGGHSLPAPRQLVWVL
jgi:hypothetical protein